MYIRNVRTWLLVRHLVSMAMLAIITLPLSYLAMGVRWLCHRSFDLVVIVRGKRRLDGRPYIGRARFDEHLF